MRDQFYLYFDKMPEGTSQQKGVYVRNGKPMFYEKESVKKARQEFMSALRPHAPKTPCTKPIKLVIWFAFDVKDKKLWGKPKPTKPDTDNFLKLFKDCMQATGYFKDDSQVVDERVFKTYSEKASVMVCYQEVNEISFMEGEENGKS